MDGKLSCGETALGLKRQDPWLTKSNLHSLFPPKEWLKWLRWAGVVANVVFLTLWRKRQRIKFKVSLGYTTRSRPAWFSKQELSQRGERKWGGGADDTSVNASCLV